MLSNELSVADVLETNWKYFVILYLCLIQHFLAVSLSSLLYNEMLGSLSPPTKSLDIALVLFVCLYAGLLKKLRADSDEIFRLSLRKGKMKFLVNNSTRVTLQQSHQILRDSTPGPGEGF